MSYADVAAHNAPPSFMQPHADPALLNTATPTDRLADDTAKVNVVPPDFKQHFATTTSETVVLVDVSSDEEPGAPGAPKKKSKKQRVKKEFRKAEEEGVYLWEVAKEQLLRPGVAGGLLGIVNVGLIAGAGYAYYTRPYLRTDAKALGLTAGAALAVLGAEGYAAETYRKTPRGRDEERRAREEGALIYRHAKEQILRPGVLGGLVGVANLGILGTVGYFVYVNWDEPHWDRRTVSAVSVGLLALWGGEGYVAEQYREGKFQPPKRR